MFVSLHKLASRCLPVAVFAAILLDVVWILPTAAQESNMTIGGAALQLWPEYDDPGLLVIYAGDFTDTLGFPREVAFPLPENARGIQATVQEADGRLISQRWQVVDGKLVYTLPGPGFHIEYYVDRSPSGDQRDITYTFETPYAIDSLDIRVQQPARATEFSLTPPPDGSIIGEDGFTYSEVRKTNLKPGDKLNFNIRYKKTDQGLTRPPSESAQTALTSQAETTQATSTESSFGSRLPYLLIGVGLLALFAAAIYWFVRGRPSTNKANAEGGVGRSKTGPATAPTQGNDKGTAFCTQCGRQFGAEDRFCANCGARR